MPEEHKPETDDEPKQSESPEAPSHEAVVHHHEAKVGSDHKSGFWHKVLHNKKILIPSVILLIVIILMAVPYTRYKILGLFIKRNFAVTVTDTQTGRAVSEANVLVGDHLARTNGAGAAVVKNMPVGPYEMKVSKKYYQLKTADIHVGLDNAKNHTKVMLRATGRSIIINITNKISSKPVKDATVAVLGTKVKTNAKGEAVLVLPADKLTAKAVLAADGYNPTEATVVVTNPKPTDNIFTLTPAGKVYFLSKQSGKIDVVKTNLDGTDRQVVLAGTGREEDASTVLLASKDWKYLLLHARRDSDKAKLYLIDTSNDKNSVIDEGDATYVLGGWQGHQFVYIVNRNKKAWEPKAQAIKSFDADKKALTTIRENQAVGDINSYQQEIFDNLILLHDNFLYNVSWSVCCSYSNNLLDDKQDQIVQGKAGSTQASLLLGLPAKTTSSILGKTYTPNEVYYQVWSDLPAPTFYEYEDGKIKKSDIKQDQFDKQYPDHFESPSANEQFWSEDRDGKSVLFVGNAAAQNPQIVGKPDKLAAYGWFTDKYLLASKENSELYILARDGSGQPIKISDYHKPVFYRNGYGGGY